LKTSVVRFCKIVVRVCGVLAAIIGFFGLLGWVLDVEVLKAVFTGGVTIKANAAVCLMLLGTALFLLLPEHAESWWPVAAGRVMASVAMAVGGLTFVEHLSGKDFGIDQLLFHEPPGAAATASPGRMGPPASASFLLSGLALLMLDVRTRRGAVPSQWLALLIGLIALLPLIGYAYSIQSLFGIAKYTGIAVHTAVAIAALAVGLLASRPTTGLMVRVSADDAGGEMARRLLIPAILIPFALGWLRTVGERAGLFDAAFGRPILILSLIVSFTSLVWWNAGTLSLLGRGRKRAEEGLRAGEARHAAGVEAALDCIISMDHEGRVTEWNPAAERTFGYTRDEARGRELAELIIPPALRESHRRGLAHYLATGEGPVVGKRFEIAAVRKDGQQFPVELSITRLPSQGPPAFTGYLRDIGERKRVEEERAKLLDAEQAARLEAERASRVKDEFLATLSHELRTPLNAILGWATILRGGNGQADADDLRQGLETIERNARVQTRIIEDLLDMSRIISGKVRLDVQRLSLEPVLRAAVETVTPAADAKGVRIQAVLDPLAGPVSGDPNRLQQVFWNLLTNAIKFTPKGGGVQLVLERVNSQLEVSVIDSGEGIRPEFLPHVFDRFRQADPSTTRRHGGLGLGLSLVKQLVELHGGTVRAKSAGVGQGSTFTVSLPLTVVHPEREAEALRRHPQVAATTTFADEMCVQIDGLKVLVVDDEADARTLLRRLLEDCGAIVTTAASAAEALERLVVERPDVLISDIGMPGEDGYSLIRRVRALGPENSGNIPAVALTAYAGSEDRTRSILAGFQMHIAKPVEPTELLAVVASVAGRR
jgi:PAS domain S-box-containing protein